MKTIEELLTEYKYACRHMEVSRKAYEAEVRLREEIINRVTQNSAYPASRTTVLK